MRDLGGHSAYHSSVALKASVADGYAIVLVAGELDMNTNLWAKDRILDEPDLRQPLLVLDLTALEFLDSSGIRALVLVHRGVTPGTRLAFVTDSAHLRKLFRISGLDQVVTVHDRLADALAGPDQGEPASAG